MGKSIFKFRNNEDTALARRKFLAKKKVLDIAQRTLNDADYAKLRGYIVCEFWRKAMRFVNKKINNILVYCRGELSIKLQKLENAIWEAEVNYGYTKIII